MHHHHYYILLLLLLLTLLTCRIQTWWRVQASEKIHSQDKYTKPNEMSEMEQLNIEKRQDMNVTTSAGSFSVRM